MARPRTLRRYCSIACAALLLAGCGLDHLGEDRPARAGSVAQPQQTYPELPERFERLLGWGSGPNQVTLRSPGPERVALGPDAVALTPSGGALLLDQLGGRVLRVAPSGSPEPLATVPVPTALLVAGPDGAFAAYSPLHATAWLFGPDGTPGGELRLPRIFHEVQALSLGPSRRLSVRNGHQDTIPLGSPAAPMAVATSLRSKRSGAAFLADGRGVIARVRDGHAEIAVLTAPTLGSPRNAEAATHGIAGEVRAARVVGALGNTVCLRLEQVSSSPGSGEIAVSRRCYCMNAASGEVLLDEPLPRPGLYLPGTELAVGGGRLAFIHAEPEGLRLRSWRLPNAAAAEEASP